MAAYYNENDPFAAAWLRNLISAGHLPPGDVDDRSIKEVGPDDLRPYTQCHFFAGIGLWSHALRLAGWPDDRPVWTGSCPCQPFSAAGRGKGAADERHLFPHWFHLIDVCEPPVVFGEQVASKDGLGWLDLVQADLEGAGYAVGAADLCAAGVAAPHIRQRLWFVAERVGNTLAERLQERGSNGRVQRETVGAFAGQALVGGSDLGGLGVPHGAGPQPGRQGSEAARYGGAAVAAGGHSGLADADGGNAGAERQQPGGEQRQQPQDGGAGGLADTDREDQGGRGVQRPGEGAGEGAGAARERPAGLRQADGLVGCGRPCPDNVDWRDADWLFCRDGKWRPVEPGTFPLAYGYPQRVGRLRAYGNAIVPQVAAAFVGAYMEARK